MKKKITKVLLWTISLFTLLLVLFTSVLYLNRDKVQNAILESLQEQLLVPIEIGEAQISLKKFPKASLKFNSIYSKGLENSLSDTLIAANEVFFLFDLWEIIKGNITIDQIHIEKADINLLYLKNNYNNFTIWKKTKSSENQLFTLSHFRFYDVNFHLIDQNRNLEIELDINRNSLSGNFSSDSLKINSKGDFKITKFISPDFSIFNTYNFNGNFSLNSNNNDSLTFFGQADFLNSHFNFEGISEKDNFSVNVSSNDIELENTSDFLLNEKIIDSLDWRISGRATCDFNYESKLSKKAAYSLEFSTENSDLSNTAGLNINNLLIEGSYTQNQGIDNLQIERFIGQSSEGEIDGKLYIKDFQHPFLKLNLNASLSLNDYLKLNPVDTIENASGKVKLVFDFQNQFKSFTKIRSRDLQNVKTNGSISLDDCEILFKDWEEPIKNLNGDLVFDNQKLKINRLFFKFKDSDLYLDGSFNKLVNYIALPEAILEVNCRLKSQVIKLPDFIKNKSQGQNSYNLNFTDRINLDLSMELEEFYMEKFSATDIRTRLKIRKGIISIDELDLNSDEGHYSGNLAIDTRNKDQYKVDAKLNFNNINIHKLFQSFNNFGQDAIEAKNIEGIVQGNAIFNSLMNNKLEINPQSITLESDIKIIDGHIKDYEPMLELSKFSDIEDLKDVYFHSLENHISIKNSIIHIPSMLIESNILNLQINGSHGFTNIVDYRIKLKASDALFNKRRKNTKATEFDQHLELMERKDEHFIFIKMYGPMDNLKIELDKKSIGQSINQDLKNQKEELKNLLKKEKEDKKTDDPGINYEWDDDDDG